MSDKKVLIICVIVFVIAYILGYLTATTTDNKGSGNDNSEDLDYHI